MSPESEEELGQRTSEFMSHFQLLWKFFFHVSLELHRPISDAITSAQKRYVTSLGTLVKEEMSRVKKTLVIPHATGIFPFTSEASDFRPEMCSNKAQF